MLTDAEVEVAAYAVALRVQEQDERPLWFAVGDDAFLAAHALSEKGWLDRHAGEDLLWRLSDRGLVARELSALTGGASPN